MDLTALAAYTGLGIALIGFAGTLLSKKVRAPEDEATERRDTIADRDALIDSFKEDIRALKEDVKAQKAETAELRKEVKAVHDDNNSLKAALYRVLSILREKNLLGLLKPGDIPEDIHY